MKFIRKFISVLFGLNDGTYHQYYSDPEQGPSGACYQSCKRCKDIEQNKLTPLERALK